MGMEIFLTSILLLVALIVSVVIFGPVDPPRRLAAILGSLVLLFSAGILFGGLMWIWGA